MSEPSIINATRADLASELFWIRLIDPVAREHGLEPPTQLRNADLIDYLFEHHDGRVLLIVRTDLEGA